jgi:hypothetical protein
MVTTIEAEASKGMDHENACLRHIARQRRDLATAEQDLREELADQRAKIKGLVERLADSSDRAIERDLRVARGQLKHLVSKHDRAASELADFNDANPGPLELARQERRLAIQTEPEAQQPIRAQFKANTARRLELLCELQILEDRARELFKTAERWRHSVPGGLGQPGVPEAAGIPMTLLNFLEPVFFHWNGTNGGDGTSSQPESDAQKNRACRHNQ